MESRERARLNEEKNARRRRVRCGRDDDRELNYADQNMAAEDRRQRKTKK